MTAHPLTPAILVLEDGRTFRGSAWGAEGRTLGEILLATQAGLPPGPGVREVMLTFNLLGDPALRLR